MKLLQKERKAIEFIRKASDLALSMSDEGFHVAFSGGKDSQTLYHLMQLSGCKFTAHMQVTTIDPPQLMRFVRHQYPEVQLHLPKKTMRELIIEKRMLPSRRARYCCKELKEHAGSGTCTCVGIRAAESVNRAKRQPIEKELKRKPAYKPVYEIDGTSLVEKVGGFDLFDMKTETVVTCVKGTDKIILSPIFSWTDNDVWTFIRGNNIPYCNLYDEGHQRLGCLFCPMASKREKTLMLKQFPRFAERFYLPVIRQIMAMGSYASFDSAESVFDWWIGRDNIKTWHAKKTYAQLQF
ncbi:phosphoadenosine phosphosulfate reductase family protein [Dysgonomonas sp. 25]|uniref:phosphoadenosine phosphosulfate reductase family protein n=1 Tax=Dysgonomonas sp. 25 TaxID=2302933 RepID=UPI0013D613C0|nr:phosphoadenosine phosphosulfate reductase family protein [Dysgonomonas sp. 25]NDV68571.1 phosphoadenosine phosphosulfate reductase [Dysgonomonas sp. 25]